MFPTGSIPDRLVKYIQQICEMFYVSCQVRQTMTAIQTLRVGARLWKTLRSGKISETNTCSCVLCVISVKMHISDFMRCA